MTTTRSRNGSHSVFVGDDAHITASTDTWSGFSTDLYVRDANIDTLVSLHLSPLALRELRDTCDRALKSIEFEDAKADAGPSVSA
jgi:hypothetical protein